jgi:hypothetical protein
MQVNGQLQVTDNFTLEPRAPGPHWIEKKLAGPQNRSGHFGKGKCLILARNRNTIS